MKPTMKLLKILLFSVISILLFSCKDDEEPMPTNGTLSGTVTDFLSAEALADVRLVVFDATTNEPTSYTDLTGADGVFSFKLDPGIYYLKLSKQGYTDIPAQGVSPTSVTVEVDQVITSNYRMKQSSVTEGGYITGKTTSAGVALAGVLVIASDGTSGYSSVSGSDGTYYIYNVPAGSFNVQGYIAGYNSEIIDVVVVAKTENVDNTIEITAGAHGSLSGTISFLATNNGEVDVTLTHPLTKETIPGLSVKTVGASYTIDNIPNGLYIARATYNNDSYVMDPDWIIKNGEPTVSINDNSTSLNFSVTGAVKISSPMCDSLTAKPLEISEITPIFSWLPYSSTSDYVIEVSDINGNVIWGGFANDGNTVTKNIVISKDQTSILFNSDGNAVSDLEAGTIYRWKIYASKDDAKEASGWKLISVSEDQLGLFIIQ